MLHIYFIVSLKPPSSTLILTFKELQSFNSSWLIYVHSSVALEISAFCPHILFTRFVWLSEGKGLLLIFTALNYWSLKRRRNVFTGGKICLS